MFESIRKYWRQSLPGAGAALGWGAWGWEQRVTGGPDSMMAEYGFWVGLFFTGWLLGLIWSDQTRPGSWIRVRLNSRKKIEPLLRLYTRQEKPNLLGTGADIISLMVSIHANPHKDFENVQGRFTIQLNQQTVNAGPIYEGMLNRGRTESTSPLNLICYKDRDTISYYRDGEGIEQAVDIRRGDTFKIIVDVSAKGMRPVFREFNLSIRNDPYGRVFVSCQDGQQYFSFAF